MRGKRRAKRSIFFVSSAIVKEKLVSELLEAEDRKTAEQKFEEKFQTSPTFLFGPFFKKRIFQPLLPNTDLILSGETKKAIFNGWFVSANILKNPPNSAFLIFESRLDGKKMSRPQNRVVLLQDLELKEKS